MYQMLSIFIYLTVLQFCVSESDKCIEEQNFVYDNTTIYLLIPNTTSTEDTNNDLQKLFHFVNSVKYTLKRIPEFCPGDVNGTLKAIEYAPNIINLFVSDFFEHNYATIMEKNLVFGGKTRLKNNANCTGNDSETLPDTCFDVLLLSESIIDLEDLYIYTLRYWLYPDTSGLHLESTPEDNSPKPLAILVCLEEMYNYNAPTRYNIQVIIEDYNRCSETMKRKQDLRLVAILAPKPFTINYETPIPTLFYNHRYISNNDKATFPNSMSVLRQWKPLKLAFVKFMRTMKWKRVAMISDDSEYSEAFESEMLHELNRHSFTYHSYGCSYKTHCDVDEMVSSMLHSNPRIVIVNIGEEKAMEFLNSIRKSIIRNIVWLVRDWPFPHDYIVQYRLGRFYSISLDNQERYYRFPQPRILAGIDTIVDAYESSAIKNNEALYSIQSIRESLYRELNTKYQHHPQDVVVASINDMTNNVQDKIVYIIDKYSEVTVLFKNLFDMKHPDRKSCEIIDAENYFEPCGDQDILLLFLVVIVFCIILLLVAYYVNNVPYTNSYTNL